MSCLPLHIKHFDSKIFFFEIKMMFEPFYKKEIFF